MPKPAQLSIDLDAIYENFSGEGSDTASKQVVD
jgi:hypothetical protein